MKKKNLKSLNLNKKSISNLETKIVSGGAVAVTTTVWTITIFYTKEICDPSDSLSCWNDSCGCPSVRNAC